MDNPVSSRTGTIKKRPLTPEASGSKKKQKTSTSSGDSSSRPIPLFKKSPRTEVKIHRPPPTPTTLSSSDSQTQSKSVILQSRGPPRDASGRRVVEICENRSLLVCDKLCKFSAITSNTAGTSKFLMKKFPHFYGNETENPQDVVVYAFGPTGTGKSSTLFGRKGALGLIDEVFPNSPVEITIMEIGSHKLFDLVKGKPIENWQDRQYLQKCKRENYRVFLNKRARADNGFNAESSRTGVAVNVARVGYTKTITLVDLPGHEPLPKDSPKKSPINQKSVSRISAKAPSEMTIQDFRLFLFNFADGIFNDDPNCLVGTWRSFSNYLDIIAPNAYKCLVTHLYPPFDDDNAFCIYKFLNRINLQGDFPVAETLDETAESVKETTEPVLEPGLPILTVSEVIELQKQVEDLKKKLENEKLRSEAFESEIIALKKKLAESPRQRPSFSGEKTLRPVILVTGSEISNLDDDGTLTDVLGDLQQVDDDTVEATMSDEDSLSVVSSCSTGSHQSNGLELSDRECEGLQSTTTISSQLICPEAAKLLDPFNPDQLMEQINKIDKFIGKRNIDFFHINTVLTDYSEDLTVELILPEGVTLERIPWDLVVKFVTSRAKCLLCKDKPKALNCILYHVACRHFGARLKCPKCHYLLESIQGIQRHLETAHLMYRN